MRDDVPPGGGLSNEREESEQPFGARREHREIGRHAIRSLLHLLDEPGQDLPVHAD